MSGKNTGNQKGKVHLIFMSLFGFGALLCIALLISGCIAKKNAAEQYQELKQTVLDTETEADIQAETAETEEIEKTDSLAERGIEVPKLALEWSALSETNEDIYAWIYIPETNVNYPVLQHETELDYYLERNLDHSVGLPGCIYTQNLNEKDFTDKNTILYGHNMKDGSMFKTLHSFSDSEFFEENRYIYIYTPDKVLVYEIYAACEYSNAHLLYKYDFTSGDGVIEFTKDLKESRAMSNQIQETIEVAEESCLLTLSTCIANKPNNRWIVVGVLLGEKEIGEE